MCIRDSHNGSATGLCFDVKTGQIINPSLQNIYKQLESEGHYPTKNGDLKHWAKQGVLLINSALTVEKGSPESHLEIWAEFFKKVLERLSDKEFIVWALFGKKAADYKKHITHPLHPVVETTHPSPYSAMKASSSQPAFMGSGVFNTINQHLYEHNIQKIAW
jgi:uracil-DNA glycosylase